MDPAPVPERESASHPAQLTNARVGGLPEPLGLHRRLPEEEKHLIVIGVLALRDPEGPNELWFWKEQEADRRQTLRGIVDFPGEWVNAAAHGPLSQRESCCSVRMDGRLPMLRKMVKSRPIRSVATPAYSSSPRRRSETSAWSSVMRTKLHFGLLKKIAFATKHALL